MGGRRGPPLDTESQQGSHIVVPLDTEGWSGRGRRGEQPPGAEGEGMPSLSMLDLGSTKRQLCQPLVIEPL